MADVKLPVLSIKEIAKQAAEIALDEITFETGGKTYTLREFTEKIKKGEFAEVQDGEWKQTEKLCRVLICSRCQYQANSHYNFCPNCGVKIKKGCDQWQR